MKFLHQLFGSFCFAIVLVSPAVGALITAAPVTGITVTFPVGPFNCVNAASSATVAGFSVAADGPACFSGGPSWGLGTNGRWEMGLVGDNSASTTITIDLGGLYSSVGGFMNYCEGFCTNQPILPPTITALAADGTTVLETYDLSVAAPIDTGIDLNLGTFRGISRDTADIRFFQFGGTFAVMHDITLAVPASVSEPAILTLLGLGLAALGFRRRKGRSLC
jgi:PEP-CTERM motif